MKVENVKVVHFVPGRVRLRSDELQGDPSLAKWLKTSLDEIPAVHGVEVSSLTGSILISYKPAELRNAESKEALIEAVRMLFPGLNVSKLLARIA